MVDLYDYLEQEYSINEIGKFQIKTEYIIKDFTKLSEAYLYYDTINTSKALWDMTNIPELLDYSN